MSGMPELGSRISLISKADIRYEGRLFTVDPQECTIALAGVQSFGTEDRETQYPISPQSQIYEYILFRGSDIKDIRVINNCAMPNDPAIMQMHLPSSNPPMMPGGPMMPGVGGGFNVPNNMPHMNNGPPPMGNFVPFNQMGGFGNMPGNNMNAPNMGNEAAKKKDSGPNEIPNDNKEKLGGGLSRSATPASLSSRKSPTVDSASQTNVNKGGKSGPDNRKPHQTYQRNANQQPQQQRNQDNQGVNMDYRYNNRNRQQNNNMQRNWNNRGPPQNNRNNQRFRGRPQGNFNNGNRNAHRGNRNVLKFESDYDFEQANNKFEELRLQLTKLKVGEEATQPKVNGETEKKEDSGNETGAEREHEPEDDENAGYDKTKSFFDNISCEAVERSKGKTQRTDWRQERKLNSETFGVSHNRRGNFRPRGGLFFNRGGYNNRSGAFRDNYQQRDQGDRSGNNRSSQNNSQQPQNNQQQNQQQRPVNAK